MMLKAVSALRRMSIHAVDGDIGSVHDIFFDDDAWVIRYVVVDTRRWLPGRKVLISPFSISGVDWQNDRVHVSIARDQVKGSPEVDTDKPVSRQHEANYLGYYGYPLYWGGPLAWGPVAYPRALTMPAGTAADEAARREENERADPHLRSAKEVIGYGIEATDGAIGHADDFLYDEQSWALRFLTIDTRNWLPGRRVLVSTEWVDEVSWRSRQVRVGLGREAIQQSPEWHAEEDFGEDDELALYRHYGRTPGPTRGIQIR